MRLRRLQSRRTWPRKVPEGMSQPLSFSVIVPTYNRDASLLNAVESILQQDAPPDEVIIVDDGSKNDVAAVLEPFADQVMVIRQANAGASAARNTGARAATGHWLLFLDSDDVWKPGRMTTLRRDLAAMGEEAIVHIGDVRYVGAGYSTRLLADIKQRHFPTDTAQLVAHPLDIVLSGMTLQGAAIRAEVWQQMGGLDETMPMYEDTALFCQLALRGAFLVNGTEMADIIRLEDDALALTALERNDPVQACALRLRYLEQVAHAQDLRRQEKTLVQSRLSGAQYMLARSLLAEDRSRARQYFVRSALSHPSPWKGWLKALSGLALGAKGLQLLHRKPDAIDRSA